MSTGSPKAPALTTASSWNRENGTTMLASYPPSTRSLPMWFGPKMSLTYVPLTVRVSPMIRSLNPPATTSWCSMSLSTM